MTLFEDKPFSVFSGTFSYDISVFLYGKVYTVLSNEVIVRSALDLDTPMCWI